MKHLRLSASTICQSLVKIYEDKLVYVGDTILFKVFLFDGYGKLKSVGGDHLRARLFNDSIKAYTNGHITDHKNGTYTVQVDALWSGAAHLEVELLFTREVIAAMLRLRRDWHFRDARAIFTRFNISESTQCSADDLTLRDDTGYSSLCNLFYWNNTMPWFCVKPHYKNLSCSDLSFYKHNWIGFVTNLSKCELHLANRELFTIGKIISITILPTSRSKQQAAFDLRTIPCTKYSRKKLWFLKNSTGYFYNGKWILRHCKGELKSVGECLRNTVLYFWGDSTLHQWFNYFHSHTNIGCKIVYHEGKGFFKRIRAYCKQYNLLLIYIPHNIPAAAAKDSNINTTFANTLHDQLNCSKTVSKRILVIHLYAHIQLQSIKFFIANMLSVRRYLEQVIKQDCVFRIFIKLPHTHREERIETWTIRQPDYIGFLYTFIIREMLRGLHQKVIPLNNRDATTAVKSMELHPNKMLVSAMVETLLNYICNNRIEKHVLGK
ncbi:NXPE family member 3-like isoform X2 [Mercenaria mercenaria]|uniref:NXPE family member 3-like isoform X2 n=1 Tax=Mercenaria mercenaria TaxID=6596 RepID=UPI00234F8EE4|nr:NXPE family member 3-like isoform X2 [Mercenaria mercenaria]XP_053397037.1 NXPE family member 3-like isoform X2 [Mercenaria mercenaria]